jgi:N-acetylglucosamine-6-phosphate deacetylase
MPTVATNGIDVFYRCIDAIRSYWEQKGQGVLGLHIEGPWINPVKRGAHIASFIHPPSLDEVKRLLDYGQDVIRMITLAPEVCDDRVIDYIQQRGIIVSAGHSNATYKQATRAFKRGIPVATHLYNAMSPLQHREPGLVGAVLNGSKVCCSIIPDGHHVDFAAITIAKKIMGERLFAITDAVTETNEGDYQHLLVGDKYEAGGILSGSALTMLKAVRNLVHHAGADLAEAIRMCSLYPARVIHEEQNMGSIAPGALANLLVLDRDLNMIKLVA